MTAVDCLITPGTMAKGRMLVQAAHDGALSAGLDSRIFSNNKPRDGALVVLYGLGGSDRIGYAGLPNVISFDAGYWERKLGMDHRKYRVSIGGFHCPDRIFRGPHPGPDRWNESGLSIAESGGNPAGPILLVGNGPKSNRIGAASWCAEMSRNLREWFPKHTIWYRPKPRRAHDQCVVYDGIADDRDIDKVLAQCSLVVCRHSNVAVDCARIGVPCVCDDGAAAAIYDRPASAKPRGPKTRDPWMPRDWERRTFLHRLAWWQWSISEIRGGLFWPWMLKQLEASR